VLVQLPEQTVSPVGQVAWHLPAWQALPPVHALPQVPQFWLSVLVFVQNGEPASAPPSAAHIVSDPHVSPHVPPLHTVPLGHVWPHAPQLPLSVWMDAQYGAPPSGTQVVSVPQVVWHVPPEQTWFIAQALLQLPQFERSLWVSVHFPPQTVPVQEAASEASVPPPSRAGDPTSFPPSLGVVVSFDVSLVVSFVASTVEPSAPPSSVLGDGLLPLPPQATRMAVAAAGSPAST
jgi:hypothetical protein